MKNGWVPTMLLAAGLLVAGCGPADAPPDTLATEDEVDREPAEEVLRTALSGAAEVPGPGDPEGSGSAVIRLRPDTGEVCFDLTVENIDQPTAAHIHSGAADAAGPPVINLDIGNQGLSGCVQADAETIRSVQASPADYYVNVHNAEYPAGAVRGQLMR